MTQTALPASDVSDGDWTPQPIYPELRKNAPDDSTFVSSSSDPQGDYFEVKLDPLAWPQAGPNPGSQILKVRLQQTGGGAAIPATVMLVQGTTVIAARNYQATAAFAEYDMVLTDAEGAAITNYADLRVRVYAGGPTISCCPGVTLPVALYATYMGVSIPLIWTGALWQGGGTWCGHSIFLEFHPCTTPDGLNTLSTNFPVDSCAPLSIQQADSQNCSPFQVNFTLPAADNCCGGDMTILVTA